MNKDRRFSTLLPLLVLWGMLAALFWCWIFNLLTDTTPENKITLYLDVPACDSRALALALEKALPEGMKMVQVHPFSYAMFDSDALRSADLYVIRASDLEERPEWFAPLPESLWDRADLYTPAGVPVGIRVYDPASDLAVAGSYWTTHDAKTPDGPLWLCFGAASCHLPEDPNAVSSQPVAELLLSLQ